MNTLRNDLRYAARRLLKSPGFTLIAVLTLGLGIGANTAIFSVVNAVLLRPLPFPDADRLVMVFNERGDSRVPVSGPNFLDFRDHAAVLGRLRECLDLFLRPAPTLGHVSTTSQVRTQRKELQRSR